MTAVGNEWVTVSENGDSNGKIINWIKQTKIARNGKKKLLYNIYL